MIFEFRRTMGQDDAKQRLARALSAGRFPHALLVHGEPGLGQHALLLDLAQILSCTHPEQRPCGNCFPCRGFDAAAVETLHYLIPVVKKDKEKVRDDDDSYGGRDDDDSGPESGQLDELAESMAAWHARPYTYTVPEKASVRMSQVRSLIGRLRFAEGTGHARVVLIPWLETFNEESANALLKSLEEPPPDVYFLIASERRSGLMQTLLSRCLHLGLSPLPPAPLRAAAETLARAAGIDDAPQLLPRLLPLAEGSPGTCLKLLEEGGEELLDESLRFLAAARADWRVFADYTAEIAPGAEGLEATARLLLFVLRLMRAWQTLRADDPSPTVALRGADDGYRWTAGALERAGWDASLVPLLGAFEEISDLAAFAAFVEDAYRAVRAYSKPSIALLGLFLEYEARIVREGARGVAA